MAQGGLAMAGLLAAPSLVRAQDFPTKTVRVVVPYPAGGGTDLVARLIVPRLAERWKQTVVIDNKGGASGILGSDIVAKAPPDGYTLLIMTSAHVINPFTNKNLPYDTEKDFTAITPLVVGGIALIASPKSGFDTMEKFLKEARANPGKIQWGSTENTTRMTGDQLKPYRALAVVSRKPRARLQAKKFADKTPAFAYAESWVHNYTSFDLYTQDWLAALAPTSLVGDVSALSQTIKRRPPADSYKALTAAFDKGGAGAWSVVNTH